MRGAHGTYGNEETGESAREVLDRDERGVEQCRMGVHVQSLSGDCVVALLESQIPLHRDACIHLLL